jgi:hypothetical protein
MDRLPSIDPQQPGETVHSYGARTLTFVLSTGVTATLSDRDLELADMAAMLAVCAREISAPALDRLNRCRLLLQSTLRARRRDAKSPAVLPPAAPQPKAPTPDGRDGGDLARLHPRPRVNPPAPAFVRPIVDVNF